MLIIQLFVVNGVDKSIADQCLFVVYRSRHIVDLIYQNNKYILNK